MKKTLLSLALLTFTFSLSTLSAQTINTVAGNGTSGNTGNGGQATAAEIAQPYGVNFDNSGNLYIANNGSANVRKVNTSGIISTFAGTGAYGFSGDGGQATAAQLSDVAAIYFDASGNAFIADWLNDRIRMVNTSGIISTFAGNGSATYGGDGGPATAASINAPFDITEDVNGNMFIADANNNRIREINTSGIISTLAGNGTQGYSGDGGPATAAELAYPYGVAFDASGNLIISDFTNHRIRMINTSGIISTIAGNGTSGFSGDGGPATAAEMMGPCKVVIDAGGNIYFTDYSNARARKINTNGIISTVAGNGIGSYSGDGGPATAAEISNPLGMCYDAANNLYIADASNNRIRIINNIVTDVEPALKQNDFAVYPNPANDNLTIQLANTSSKTIITIYSITGQEVLNTVKENTSNFSINIASLAAGTYLLKLQADDGSVITKKIEIAR